jgi:hypothetical protein
MSEDEFDETLYLNKLIEGGIAPSDAAETVSKMASARAATRKAIDDSSLSLFPAESASKPVMRTANTAEAKKPAKKATTPRKTATRRAAASASTPAQPQQKLTSEQLTLYRETAASVRETIQQRNLFEVAPWPDDMRAFPNDLLTTSLFTNRRTKTRLPFSGAFLYSYNSNISVTYTGIELRANTDQLVLLQILDYAKRIKPDEPFAFTFFELCNDVGWAINGTYYKLAEECLTRLQATALQFVSEEAGILESLSLIRRFRIVNRGTKKAHCEVQIDPEILLLFASGRYSKFVWEKYRALSGTARRLFDYFACHKKPYPLKLEAFQALCSSETKRLRKWKEQTEEACKELIEAGMVSNAWVENGLIHSDRC